MNQFSSILHFNSYIYSSYFSVQIKNEKTNQLHKN